MVYDSKNRLVVFKKSDNFNPCFQSIWLKIKHYSIFQLHNILKYFGVITYYLIAVTQYFAIAIILADQIHAI